MCRINRSDGAELQCRGTTIGVRGLSKCYELWNRTRLGDRSGLSSSRVEGRGSRTVWESMSTPKSRSVNAHQQSFRWLVKRWLLSHCHMPAWRFVLVSPSERKSWEQSMSAGTRRRSAAAYGLINNRQLYRYPDQRYTGANGTFAKELAISSSFA